jgi:putative zinc finger protein
MTEIQLTCKDAIEVLAEYLETSLGPELVAALERHLHDCRPCLAYLKTYKKTRTLAGEVGRVEMPDEMKRRLHRLLLEQLSRGVSG